MTYTFDPEFAAHVAMLPTVGEHLSDPAAIVASRSDPRITALLGVRADRDDVDKRDTVVPGHAGGPEVTVRVYTPRTVTAPLPALLYIHGGGFLMGSVAEMDGPCQDYCAELGALVVSVEYRLAPEHPYPAGLHDCYAGLVWLHRNADQLGVDTTRIAVGGGSAGGGLSAAVALLARDLGGPALCFQFLQIPELDDRLETASMQQFVDTPMWNRPNAEWSWKHYLGELHGRDDVPYTAAPSRCQDLSGLPPAYISTMEFDPLRDEGILYALALLRDGVPVELHSYPGTFHGSSLFPSAVGRRERDEALAVLRRALAPR